METTCDMMGCTKRGWRVIDVQNFGDLYWTRFKSCSEHVDEFVSEFKREFTEVKSD